MEKRKWTNMKLISRDHRDAEKGKSSQEIGDYFGLSKEQIVNWVTRYNKEQEKRSKGTLPRKRVRPRKGGQPPQQDEATELKRLRVENHLLRDFLQFTGGGPGQG